MTSAPEPRARVLLVDDEESIRELVRVVLQRGGYDVETAASAVAARLAMTDQIAVVLTDVRMPGMTGLELITQLRQIRPQLPVVLMSGYIGDVPMAELSSAPTAFVQKPFVALSDVLLAVRKVLEEAGQVELAVKPA